MLTRSVDPFQKLVVIEKLTSLEILPTQLTEIQEADEQIKPENSDLKKSIEHSSLYPTICFTQ